MEIRPYREVKRSYSLLDPDKGEYALTTVTRAFRIPTPHPPTGEHWNPNGIPECAPSRIQFIHFDANTLNNMYKIIDATVKHYEKDPESALSHHYRAVRNEGKTVQTQQHCHHEATHDQSGIYR